MTSEDNSDSNEDEFWSMVNVACARLLHAVCVQVDVSSIDESYERRTTLFDRGDFRQLMVDLRNNTDVFETNMRNAAEREAAAADASKPPPEASPAAHLFDRSEPSAKASVGANVFGNVDAKSNVDRTGLTTKPKTNRTKT